MQKYLLVYISAIKDADQQLTFKSYMEILDIQLFERFSSVRFVRKEIRQICFISLQSNVNSFVCQTNSQLKESKFLFEASSQTSGGTFISNRFSICSESSISSFWQEPK
ncbi:Hypothetical_protein [Hexamita inflata]|uniref:Hypothetical_protein n=1 Tax=Hexamita inflata TaxID=28002 RepID=A0AA86RKA0_9EUKA|nr:Hypothetical protein HINF_LOCUS61194 [Hexamita inflata]